MAVKKRLKILCACAAAALACSCALTGPHSDSSGNAALTQDVPRIAFETQSHDFGTVQYSMDGLTHEFIFTNAGTAALLIKNVKAG